VLKQAKQSISNSSTTNPAGHILPVLAPALTPALTQAPPKPHENTISPPDSGTSSKRSTGSSIGMLDLSRITSTDSDLLSTGGFSRTSSCGVDSAAMQQVRSLFNKCSVDTHSSKTKSSGSSASIKRNLKKFEDLVGLLSKCGSASLEEAYELVTDVTACNIMRARRMAVFWKIRGTHGGTARLRLHSAQVNSSNDANKSTMLIGGSSAQNVFPADTGIVGHVAQHCEPIDHSDANPSEYFFSDVDYPFGAATGVHSILAVPVVSHIVTNAPPTERCLGVVVAYNKSYENAFRPFDVYMLSSFADMLAQCHTRWSARMQLDIRSTMASTLLQQLPLRISQAKEVTQLTNMLQQVGMNDAKVAAQNVSAYVNPMSWLNAATIRLVAQLVHADQLLVFMREDVSKLVSKRIDTPEAAAALCKKPVIHCIGGSALPSSTAMSPFMYDALANYVIRTGKSVHVDDAKLDPRFAHGVTTAATTQQQEVASIVCVPVISGNGLVYGCIQARIFTTNSQKSYDAVSLSQPSNRLSSDGKGTLTMALPPTDSDVEIEKKFCPSDRQLLSSVGSKLGHDMLQSYKRAQVFARAATQQRRTQERVLDYFEAMSMCKSLHNIFGVMSECIRRVAPLPKDYRMTVSVFLVDEVNHKCFIETSSFYSKEYSMKLDPDLISFFSDGREPLVLNAAECDHMIPAEHMHTVRQNTRREIAAIMYCPILDAVEATGHKLIGLLECIAVKRSSKTDKKAEAEPVRPRTGKSEHVSSSKFDEDEDDDDEEEDTQQDQLANLFEPQRKVTDASLIFSEHYKNTAARVTAQGGALAVRAQLANTLRDTTNRNAALVEIVKTATSGLEVEDIVQAIIKKTYRILDVDRVTLFNVDEIRGELWCKISKDAEGFRIPLNKGIVGHVATTGVGVNIHDAYTCPYFSPAMDKKTGFRTKHILCLPIKDKTGRVIAVTQAVNKNDRYGRPFSTEDEALLRTVNREIGNVLRQKSLEATYSRLLSVGTTNDPKDATNSYIAQFTNMVGGMLGTQPQSGARRRPSRKHRAKSVHARAKQTQNENEAADQKGTVNDADADPQQDGGYRSDRRTLENAEWQNVHAKLKLRSAKQHDKYASLRRSVSASSILSKASLLTDAESWGGDLSLAGSPSISRSASRFSLNSFNSDGNNLDPFGDLEDRGSLRMKRRHESEDTTTSGMSTDSNNESGSFSASVQISDANSNSESSTGDASANANQLGGSGRGISSKASTHASDGDSKSNNVADTAMAKTSSQSNSDLGPTSSTGDKQGRPDSETEAPERQHKNEEVEDQGAVDSDQSADREQDADQPEKEDAQSSTQEVAEEDTEEEEEIEPLTLTIVGSPHEDLQDILSWEFNCFAVSDERLLVHSFNMFKALDLVSEFSIDEAKLTSFLRVIHDNYRDNPYHNFRHGFSVLHCCFMVMTDGGKSTEVATQYFDVLDVFACLVAGYCHDVDHPGYGNSFLVQSDDELAVLYNDKSVLENHHSALAFQLMYQPEHNIIENLPIESKRTFRKMVMSSILATDMSLHMGMTTDLQNRAGSESGLSRSSEEDRQLVMNTIVHGADLSNPMLPMPISGTWATLVLQEFNAQAAKEEELGLPVTSFMVKSDDISKANLNLGFINYVVHPLWKVMATDIFPHLQPNLNYCEENKKYWNELKSTAEAKAKAEEEAKAKAEEEALAAAVAAAEAEAEAEATETKSDTELDQDNDHGNDGGDKTDDGGGNATHATNNSQMQSTSDASGSSDSPHEEQAGATSTSNLARRRVTIVENTTSSSTVATAAAADNRSHPAPISSGVKTK
jgi:GAF domain-containing protein